jgi:hypothetical protein
MGIVIGVLPCKYCLFGVVSKDKGGRTSTRSEEVPCAKEEEWRGAWEWRPGIIEEEDEIGGGR